MQSELVVGAKKVRLLIEDSPPGSAPSSRALTHRDPKEKKRGKGRFKGGQISKFCSKFGNGKTQNRGFRRPHPKFGNLETSDPRTFGALASKFGKL